MACGCHITGWCWARQDLSILEPHLASVSCSLSILTGTLLLMSLNIDWRMDPAPVDSSPQHQRQG